MSAIKERPILFSAPMVRAILEGRKTVTRHVVKVQPRSKADIGSYGLGQPFIRNPDVTKPNPECPYGRPGDHLWVRETFALLGNEDGACVDWDDHIIKGDERNAARIYRASCTVGDYGLWMIPPTADWKPDTEEIHYEGAWRPSIFMPRWASRILLEITDVRVERLQDISEGQARAEGIRRMRDGSDTWVSREGPANVVTPWPTAKEAFSDLWDSINGPHAWEANPWVWAITFRRVEQ